MRSLGRARHLIAVWLLLIFAGTAAEVCKGAKVPQAERDRYDARAFLSPAERGEAIKPHLPWGEPACPMLLPQVE